MNDSIYKTRFARLPGLPFHSENLMDADIPMSDNEAGDDSGKIFNPQGAPH